MVSDTTYPERRASLRALSRPSQLAFGVALLAVISGVTTYVLLTGLTSYTLDSTGLVILMLINLALVLTLASLIGWRLARLWATRRSGRAGAKLHVRLVAWFSTIAVVPAILVAVFATVTLNVGMAAWFSSNVRTALDGSVNISRQYVKEQFDRILIDAVEISDGIQLDRSIRDNHGNIQLGLMFAKLESMTRDRGLAGSFLVDSHGMLLGSSSKLKYTGAITPSAADIADARRGSPVAGADAATGLVRALIHLDAMNDAYLLIVRVVDPAAFNYYQRNRGAVSEYHQLEQNRQKLQIIFALLYGMVSLVVLLAAIWSGLWAANRLVRPISGLIDAAGKVSEGDLDAQVRVARDDDELASLGLAFNRMTQQLSAQRNDLITANRLNEARRRFTETVLSGVSAGVIGIDGEGKVTIVNRAAARLMDAAPEDLEAIHYSQSVPELAPLILRAMSEPAGRAGGEVTIRRAGTPRALSVQVTSERGSADGFVVTFDDITD
ncbi:MAG TPA: HAMP domain-containing protein, partial [Rhizomicrobium sp.]